MSFSSAVSPMYSFEVVAAIVADEARVVVMLTLGLQLLTLMSGVKVKKTENNYQTN